MPQIGQVIAERGPALLVLGVLLAAGSTSCRKAESVAPPLPVSTRTESGVVRGTTKAGIRVFRGIPYAAPPVGPLRWRPPRAAATWEGVRDAVEFGASCPQPGAPEPMTEDCLTLNVWSPEGLAEDSRLPVMVWIHGGGFRSGAGSDHVSHGLQLARDGVVLVTFNYRLGALGFLAHPLLEPSEAGEAWANYGILDMVAALEWVQRNIRAFGGDPSRVTIFGNSAGGMSVDLLMVAPRAKGLFHRAIAMSGYGTWPLPRTRAAAAACAPGRVTGAEAVARSLVERATRGAPVESAEQLRAIPATDLANAVDPLHLPVVDGVVLPEEPGVVFDRGGQHDVPFMTGGDRFDGSVMPSTGLSTAGFREALGSGLDPFRALYAEDFAVSEERGTRRLFGDARYVLAARHLARSMGRVSSPGYLYYFDLVPPGDRGGPGAPHGSEVGPLFRPPSDDAAGDVGRLLRACWISFARTGDPNGPGCPRWPAYDGDTDEWLVIDGEPGARSGVIDDRLDALEERYRERVGCLEPVPAEEATP